MRRQSIFEYTCNLTYKKNWRNRISHFRIVEEFSEYENEESERCKVELYFKPLKKGKDSYQYGDTYYFSFEELKSTNEIIYSLEQTREQVLAIVRIMWQELLEQELRDAPYWEMYKRNSEKSRLEEIEYQKAEWEAFKSKNEKTD